MPDLSVTGLSVDYRTDTRIIHAVRAVDFPVRAGERVGIVGESGSGKTTTALALLQLIKAPGRIAAGEARLGEVDLLALRGAAVRKARLQRVAYIPQGAMNSLNPVLRVREQILDGAADHGIRLSAKEAAALVDELLTSVGLDPAVASAYPHMLSGGMKQRVCIAIGISLRPDLLVADEPTSALDVITQRQVMATLVEVQERMGCGLILIGHDMGLMAQATHRIVVMRDGVVVEDAPVGRLFAAPAHPYSRELIESLPAIEGRLPAPAVAPARVAETTPLLSFDRVTKSFGAGVFGGRQKVALDTCSFALSGERPRIIAVVGQSGSGKTTMARMILNFETPTSGTVSYRGRPLSRMTGAERWDYRREVQAIFQDPYGSFNPFYKVDRPLARPLRHFGLANTRQEVYARIEEACAAVGLDASEVLGRFPHELSGGQRQRLMVARALMLRPRLIVADEPVSMVDASLRMTILGNLETLRSRYNVAVVYITHDMATAYHVSDYVLVLHAGRIVEAGTPEAVIRTPAHPYTQSLVAAIPWPDPARAWERDSASLRAGWGEAPVVRGAIDGFDLKQAA